MPYRFKQTESFEASFRRIAREQIVKAKRSLFAYDADYVSAVHDARKAMKRLRALLRIVRPEIGEKVFRRENARFRDVARCLSLTRDRHVMLQTLGILESKRTFGAAAPLAAIRRQLSVDVVGMDVPAHRDIDFVEIRGELENGLISLHEITVSQKDFDVVGRGIEKTYRKGRKTFQNLFGDDVGSIAHEALHDWRKDVQLHWRHIALVREAAPEECAERVLEGKALAQALGMHNDLCVLGDYIGQLSATSLSKRKARQVRNVIREELEALRVEIEPMGRKFYAERPRGLRESLAWRWQERASQRTNAQRDIPRLDVPARAISQPAPQVSDTMHERVRENDVEDKASARVRVVK